MKKLSIVLILVLVVGLVSCATDAATNDTQTVAVAVNANCPMQGRAVAEGKLVEYKGTTIGLCCDSCMAAWGTLSAERKDELLATAIK
jgi:hypothetical protein